MADSSPHGSARYTTTSSREKKRLRDRRAQQKLREKRDVHIKDMEDQLKHCKQHHRQSQDSNSPSQTSESILENETLRARHDKSMEFALSLQQNIAQLISSISYMKHASSVGTSDDHGDNTSDTSVAVARSYSHNGRYDIAEMLCSTDASMEGSIAICDDAVYSRLSDANHGIIEREPTLQTTPSSLEHHPGAPLTMNSFRPSHQLDSDHGFRHLQRVRRPASSAFADRRNIILPPVPSSLVTDRESTSALSRDRTSSFNMQPARPRNTVRTMSFPWNSSQTTQSPPTFPRWSMTPNNMVNDLLMSQYSPWFLDPDSINASPDIPKPTDLLFGSPSNMLANQIHAGLRRARVGEPERLAIGWLLYAYSKWRAFPTEERYNRLPTFFRPTDVQLVTKHSHSLDLVLWPELRQNMTNHSDLHEAEEAFRLLSCCLKLRWVYGEEILRHGPNGDLQIREEFRRVFTSVEGWGLTNEFIQSYPHLLDGIDKETIKHTLC